MTTQPRELTAPQRCRRFLYDGIEPGMDVLDLGCGEGEFLRVLTDKGCRAIGVDIDPRAAEACRAAGLDARVGAGEAIPLPDASVDAIICSVAIPYMDERRAIAECARVLRPGGALNISCHGDGFALEYLLGRRPFHYRVYAVRMLVNTALYRLTGRRLPGFLGDSLCESDRAMRRYYAASGLRLERAEVMSRWLGVPQYFCHRATRSATT